MSSAQWSFAYREVDRPPANRRTLADPDLDQMDRGIELALLTTLKTGLGIEMLLWQFHSTPAKGRLWKQGYRVLHRVRPNRRQVVAWLVPENTVIKNHDTYLVDWEDDDEATEDRQPDRGLDQAAGQANTC